MSNINNNMQTQTSNSLHNAIMEADSKDRPPMLAPGNYIQWKSRIKRYIDTKPNLELIHYCLENPPYELGWKDKFIIDAEGNPTTTTHQVFETCKNVPQEIRDPLTIERLKQGESINVQDLETNLFWEFGKFTSLDGESLESYYSRLLRAATTTSSLEAEQDSGGGPRCQETIGDTTAQTRFKRVSKHSNNSLLKEKTTTTQRNEIDSLKRKVKKLENKNRSRTHRLKRLYKVGLTIRVESSSDEESLVEDASKQGKRIDAIDADEDITLNENIVEEVVDTSQVSTAAINVTITTEKLTLSQILEALKTSKPKVKGIVFQEPEKKRKHFAAKRAKKKRNKPPTKAPQRKIICTYLKNIEGYKLNDLMLKEFDSIQEMFDRAFKREPMEDQPLPADASPTTLSSDYIVNSKDEKDPKEDPAYYYTDRGNNED
nr:hypothetical protein [Tanacetum cinerariifolium]